MQQQFPHSNSKNTPKESYSYSARDLYEVEKIISAGTYDKKEIVIEINKSKEEHEFFSADDVFNMMRIISKRRSLADYPADIVAAAKKIIYSSEGDLTSREVYEATTTQINKEVDESYFNDMLYALSHEPKHREFIRCSKTIGERGTIYMWSALSADRLDEFMALPILPKEKKQYKPRTTESSTQTKQPAAAAATSSASAVVSAPAAQQSAFDKLVLANQQVVVRPEVVIYCDLSSGVATGSQVEHFNNIYNSQMVCMDKMSDSGFSITPRPKILQVVPHSTLISITFHIGGIIRQNTNKVFVFLSKNKEFQALANTIVLHGGQSHYVESFDALCLLITTNKTIGQYTN